MEYKYFKNEYIDDIQENYFKPILDDIFEKHHKSIKVVGDVGCGNGIFSAYLKKDYAVELHGFDASEYALKKAYERGFDRVILNNDFSNRSLQAEDEFYDFILNKDVFEHLLDTEFLMKEIFRVLKPGGLFLLHIPNDFNLWKRIQFVFTGNTDTYNYFPSAEEWNRPHIRFLTSDGVRKLLSKYGFEIIENYSPFFTHRFPIICKVPGYMTIFEKLSAKFPTQFSRAITFLAVKK